MSTDSVNAILAERAKTYGSFEYNASTTQEFKAIMRSTGSWRTLRPYEAEALEMIVHKISRILNGNPSYVDSWQDIAGYATLVVNLTNERALHTGLE